MQPERRDRAGFAGVYILRFVPARARVYANSAPSINSSPCRGAGAGHMSLFSQLLMMNWAGGAACRVGGMASVGEMMML